MAADPNFASLFVLLTQFHLKDLPHRIGKRGLITLHLDTSVEGALETLSRANVLSAPVLDNLGAFAGFCDMQQLVRFVSRLATGKVWPDGNFWTKNKLQTTTIEDLIRGTYTTSPITGEYALPVFESASLFQAIERMAREGQHRLAVTDKAGRVVGILTQSEVLDFIAAHKEALHLGALTPVSEIRELPTTRVETLDQSATAVRGLELLDSQPTSLNGVAVVDTAGKIVDVFSTHDLRGILPVESDMNRLWDSVVDFKDSQRLRFPDRVSFLPKTCKKTDTVGSVISAMVDNRIHRLFVVDADMRPRDIITQTDLLRFIYTRVTGNSL